MNHQHEPESEAPAWVKPACDRPVTGTDQRWLFPLPDLDHVKSCAAPVWILVLVQGSSGEAGTSTVLRLQEASQSFTFTEVAEQPVLSVLRNFSAPITLRVGPGSWLLGFRSLASRS